MSSNMIQKWEYPCNQHVHTTTLSLFCCNMTFRHLQCFLITKGKKKKKKGKERSTWCGKRAVQQGWCLLSPYSATLNVFSNYSSLKEKVTLIWINRVAIGEMSWFKKKIKKFRNNLICNKYIITLWKLSLV